jgi:hypothetical protein
MTAPKPATNHVGVFSRAASATMDQPRTQSTCRNAARERSGASGKIIGRSTRSSIPIRTKPRVHRKRVRACGSTPRWSWSRADMPARKTNVGRAQVRHPARQVQRHAGRGRIQRVAVEAPAVQVVARVVQEHQDHHGAAHPVDRVDALGSGRWGGARHGVLEGLRCRDPSVRPPPRRGALRRRPRSAPTTPPRAGSSGTSLENRPPANSPTAVRSAAPVHRWGSPWRRGDAGRWKGPVESPARLGCSWPARLPP